MLHPKLSIKKVNGQRFLRPGQSLKTPWTNVTYQYRQCRIFFKYIFIADYTLYSVTIYLKKIYVIKYFFFNPIQWRSVWFVLGVVGRHPSILYWPASTSNRPESTQQTSLEHKPEANSVSSHITWFASLLCCFRVDFKMFFIRLLLRLSVLRLPTFRAEQKMLMMKYNITELSASFCEMLWGSLVFIWINHL